MNLEGPCEVCGKSIDDCICPECPKCGGYGDPRCYQDHGLIRTAEQIAGQAALEAAMRREAAAERKWLDKMLIEDNLGRFGFDALDDVERECLASIAAECPAELRWCCTHLPYLPTA